MGPVAIFAPTTMAAMAAMAAAAAITGRLTDVRDL